MKQIIRILSIATIMLLVNSCVDQGKEPKLTVDERLIGTWVQSNSTDTQVLHIEFKDDLTGRTWMTEGENTTSAMNFNWGITNDGFLMCSYENNSVEELRYGVQNGILTIKGLTTGSIPIIYVKAQ